MESRQKNENVRCEKKGEDSNTVKITQSREKKEKPGECQKSKGEEGKAMTTREKKGEGEVRKAVKRNQNSC